LSVPAARIRLVVGLGNPGSRYERTRHNVGFRAVDRWVDGAGASWEASPVGEGEAARLVLEDGEAVWAAKPHTFMNLSGDMVQPLAHYYRIASEEILVVSDDMELPLGKLRIRPKGSAGGQNGLRSILERLGTQQIPRLRLGVGPRPEGMDAAAFVLSRFGKGDAGSVERMIERASEAIAAVCRDGVERSMNSFNGSEPA